MWTAQVICDTWVDLRVDADHFDRPLRPGSTWHGLRHFYASTLMQAGLSPKTVQVRLGHTSVKTTLDTYTHLWPAEDDRTREAVDALFCVAQNGPELAVKAT